MVPPPPPRMQVSVWVVCSFVRSFVCLFVLECRGDGPSPQDAGECEKLLVCFVLECRADGPTHPPGCRCGIPLDPRPPHPPTPHPTHDAGDAVVVASDVKKLVVSVVASEWLTLWNSWINLQT